jgi:hypothetical protein
MISFSRKTSLLLVMSALLRPSDAYPPNMMTVPANLEVVLRVPESVLADETRRYHNEVCEISFPSDGALYVRIPGSVGLWHIDFAPNPNSFCKNSDEPMRYKMQGDGNFIARCGDQIDYITHSHQDESGDYFLAIDNACYLHIFKGTLGCDKIDVSEEIWASDFWEPLGPDDRLYKGQILHLGGTSTILDPSDRDLRVRQDLSHGTYEVLWSAKEDDAWIAPPGPNIHDYYAKVTADGHLLLVGIDYTTGPNFTESIYFDKDLESGGADCFTLEFEPVSDEWLAPVEPVAVPCNGRRARQLLRGGLV